MLWLFMLLCCRAIAMGVRSNTKNTVVPNVEVKKEKVIYVVVVHAAMLQGHCNGSKVKYKKHCSACEQGRQLIGTTVFWPVPHKLRKKKHARILTLAEHIVRGMPI
ncbi:50S ribosomal protein like [Melia azedarach]|uniref:50S ribosomal protein like n=1 Tax=Melia azedarach TaxID=155640 RepID=A0ACC1YU13_MELAZ|nr:50S ribosomal protein like [Melia azedarach]